MIGPAQDLPARLLYFLKRSSAGTELPPLVRWSVKKVGWGGEQGQSFPEANSPVTDQYDQLMSLLRQLVSL